MKLSNLSVGAPGASFGAILLITALIAATGMWRIASRKSASERVATLEIEQQTLVEDWASDIRLNWVRTEAFLKAIDRDYMDKLTADTQATAKGMEAKVKRIEALVRKGDKAKGLLAAIATARQAYNDKLNEIRELHRGGGPTCPPWWTRTCAAGRQIPPVPGRPARPWPPSWPARADTSTLAKPARCCWVWARWWPLRWAR